MWALGLTRSWTDCHLERVAVVGTPLNECPFETLQVPDSSEATYPQKSFQHKEHTPSSRAACCRGNWKLAQCGSSKTYLGSRALHLKTMDLTLPDFANTRAVLFRGKSYNALFWGSKCHPVNFLGVLKLDDSTGKRSEFDAASKIALDVREAAIGSRLLCHWDPLQGNPSFRLWTCCSYLCIDQDCRTQQA